MTELPGGHAASGRPSRALPLVSDCLCEQDRSLEQAVASAARQWAPAEPTEVFESYWRFAAERQAIFFRRASGCPWPWTEDPVLRAYRFTNAYRAADRVSQFLIRHVIYGGNQGIEDVFFRTLLFRIFNRVDTWRLLEQEVGNIAWRNYARHSYDKALTRAMDSGRRIYSAAYVMPSGRGAFGSRRKHRNHLTLLESMMGDGLPSRLATVASFQEAFHLLRAYPTVGDFLAYQFATDLNYSQLMDFSEMSFVIPGPGAKSGIRKCFGSLGGLTEVEIISLVAQRQQTEFERRGIRFQSLWGRPLQLIDCQNLFCEVDKYARVVHPHVSGVGGRSRIKQKYVVNPEPVDYWFPPKWGLNEVVDAWRREHPR